MRAADGMERTNILILHTGRMARVRLRRPFPMVLMLAPLRAAKCALGVVVELEAQLEARALSRSKGGEGAHYVWRPCGSLSDDI